MIMRAFNAGICHNAWNVVDRMGLRFKTAVTGLHLIPMAIDIMVLQQWKDGAFKLSEFSQKLTCEGMRDPCPLPAMKAMDLLFNRQAQSYQDWNKTFEVGLWHEISPAGRLRVVKQGLIALAFGVMERSRGVPRRGGRSGIRIAFDEEEVHSVAPMEAMANSSSSSEQEFLLLPDSYQPIRLRIPGRLLRSDVIVNLSIYLSEAAPEDNPSSSQAPARVQSSEILLGDMNGRVYRMPSPLAAVAPVGQPPPAQVQENSDLAPSEQEILPPVHDTQDREEGHSSIQPGSEGQPQWDEDMVIWLDTPSPEQMKPPESPSHPS